MNRPRRPRPTPAPVRVQNAPGKVRLIGGRWRGTRLDVPNLDGLRPTGDRVRETLFNWLMPALPGARVLDLFAGSGALGFEAVSRGAAQAVLVERDAALAAALRATAARLGAGESIEVVQADALAWLAGRAAARFDIAFVDPPFSAGLWDAVLAAVSPALAPDAWLYVEAAAEVDWTVPAGWRVHREGRTREVRYVLLRRADAGT